MRIAVIGSGICKLQKFNGKDKAIASPDLSAYDLAHNRWLVLKVQGYTDLSADGSMQSELT